MGHRTCVLALLAASIAHAGPGTAPRTSITVWAATPPLVSAYGGLGYGGYTPPSGAMITDVRELDVINGELRLSGVAATADAASVQLRALGGDLAISEQRFVPGATTPDEILARHVGDTVTVVTPKGEVTGVLRSSDAQALVLEVGSGEARRLQVMRRDSYVQDVRLPASSASEKPSFVWRVATKKPGKQTVEVTYRAEGMAWTADYLAILDEGAKTVDFSAWATVKNQTGAVFDNAQLTLVSAAAMPSPLPQYAYIAQPARPATPPSRFAIAAPVRIGAAESVQVELLAPRKNAKTRSVIMYEAIPDASNQFGGYPATDCSQQNVLPGGPRSEVAIELDVPSTSALPDGRVRLFKRKADRLEMVNEEQLRSTAGIARIRLAPDSDVVGERHAQCTIDERTRTIHEKVEVKIENKGKQALDIVVREFLWRWPMWKIDPADESIRGVRGGTQTQEYRLAIPAGGKKSVTYTVVYSW